MGASHQIQQNGLLQSRAHAKHEQQWPKTGNHWHIDDWNFGDHRHLYVIPLVIREPR